MAKKRFFFPATYEIPVIASGRVIIEADSEQEAKELAKELKENSQEFCSHIRTNGDDDHFTVDPAAVGEIQYGSVKSGSVDNIEIDIDDCEEID